MANDNATTTELSFSGPASIYVENSELLYAITRWFVQEPVATEIICSVASQLLTAVPSSGYKRYANLLALRLLKDELCKNPSTKTPLEITFDEAFSLILRDRFQFSCFEIGAITRASEGSIRTRLERARAKAFRDNEPVAMSATGKSAKSSVHLCIRNKEIIEDWNLDGARLGQFSAPPNIDRAIGNCEICEAALQRRFSSLEYFSEQPTHGVPEKLRIFPVSPLFLKEGKRVFLNWSAAPWYVKALFEGLLATTLVLGIILSIPRIKSIYEFWLERRLDLYSIAELAAGLGSRSDGAGDAVGSPVKAEPTPQIAPSAAPADPTLGSVPPFRADDTLARANATGAEREILRGGQKASSAKIYRILIRTDAPEAVKDQVLSVLRSFNYESADDDSKLGVELPGGVLFDAFVPLQSYEPLKLELFKLGQPREIPLQAKEPGRPGKAHLKIWLQRI